MTTFWITATVIFIVTTAIAAKLTFEKFRKQTGEKKWKVGYGRSTYWELLCLSTFGITTFIMFALKWTGILIF